MTVGQLFGGLLVVFMFAAIGWSVVCDRRARSEARRLPKIDTRPPSRINQIRRDQSPRPRQRQGVS